MLLIESESTLSRLRQKQLSAVEVNNDTGSCAREKIGKGLRLAGKTGEGAGKDNEGSGGLSKTGALNFLALRVHFACETVQASLIKN